ncbi:Vacuolar protein sorting-associated protein 13D-like protein [Dinothrombium tinctorium]|uniref:Vacuolar protein sorting-associated protein 13D-like protein n=1 Tax=Dinothrombium tinctorium TaxID=1965070 RepID=A0A3S3NLE7_9ACAR|nr:Vacuolar protein sorting-associated protein 13D-like protein [Dinothrombium tinctorium]
MLERLIAWVLNSYIGEYFGNVNTDQLSVALHQGEVELDGLPLKVESLRHWGLPVDVKAGYIGKIRLKVPVYRIRSDPWLISIEELYVVAHSLTDFTYNEAIEKQFMQDYKLQLLDALELRWKSQYESIEEQSYYASSYTSWLSFGASVVSNIIENVQLKIKSVHIRYEDSTSIQGCQIACGIVVRDLYAQSADKDLDSKFNSKEMFDCMKKAVTLEGFDVYWDTHVDLIGDLELSDIVSSMRRLMDTSQIEPGDCDHNYILYSVCGQAQLVRNLSEKPLRSRSTPRLSFDLILERFPLTLNVLQYKQMLEWADEFSRTSTIWKFRKWRPMVPIKESPAAWWKYAANAHLEQWKSRIQCRKWSFITKRVKDILSYKYVYFVHLTQPETLTKEMKELKDRIETDLNFDELCIIREIVYNFVKKTNTKHIHQETSSTNSSSNSGGSWLSWITGWSTQQPDQEIEKTKDENAETESVFKSGSFEDHFLFDNIENDTFLRRDYVFAHINLIVQQASFTLVSDISLSPQKLCALSPSNSSIHLRMQPILELEFNFMRLWIELRPRVRSYKLDIKLKGLNVKDKMSEKPIFEYLISPQKSHSSGDEMQRSSALMVNRNAGSSNDVNSSQEEAAKNETKEEYLFEFIFEKKPLSTSYATELACCKKVCVRSLPLEIIYNQKTFEAFLNFFSSKKAKTGQKSKLTTAARTHYEQLKKQTRAGIQNAVGNLFESGRVNIESYRYLSATKWLINLDIRAPQIIIPENLLDLNSTLIIFDLGRLQFKNTKNGSNDGTQKQTGEDKSFDTDSETEMKSISNEEFQKFVMKTAYEEYILDLSDIQVLVGKAGSNWQFGLGRGSGPMHILNRFSISLQMERRKSPNDTLTPRVLLKGSLPKLAAYLNEHKMRALLRCLRNIVEKTHDDRHIKPIDSEIESSVLEYIETANFSSIIEQQDTDVIFFVCQFCIDEVSVAIQSQGENLVEFQVSGVEAKYQRKPKKNVVSLCVHGLLLIDAYQKFGNEFDVLMASHRDVRIVNSNENLDNSLFASNFSKRIINHGNKSDYLISAEYVLHEKDYKQTISVLFNNLDVVANQETIIELVNFFKNIIPYSSKTRKNLSRHPSSASKHPKSHLYTTDLNFNFKRLNILLLRASYLAEENKSLDRKLATATMSGTTISAHIESSNIVIQGSLSAVHLIDLVDDISLQKHQRVLSIAPDTSCEDSLKLVEDSFYQPLSKLWEPSNDKALTFIITRNNRDDTLTINSSISSLSYDHSTKLFRELTLCASEFKYYMSVVLNTIKNKATEVAMEIVTKAKHDLNPNYLEMEIKPDSIESNLIASQSRVKELVIILDLSKINMRFSYNDFTLIAHILNSLPKETKVHFRTPQNLEKGEDEEEQPVFALPSHIQKLQTLGFSKDDCIQSLQACHGNLNDAALWLTQNASTVNINQAAITPLKLCTVLSIHMKNGILCLIDDCKDTDVPLFEIGFTDMELSQKGDDNNFVGRAKSILTCDYFNRSLSGWEPLLEPWRVDFNWEYELRKQIPSKLSLGFDSEEPLNIVITSTFLDLYKTVRENWIEDYNQLQNSNVPIIRQHSPFVPFAIKNETGNKLYFYTVTSSVNDYVFSPKTPPVAEVSKLISYITGDASTPRIPQSRRESQITQQSTSNDIVQKQNNWIPVEPNEVIPFSFEDQSMTRHQNLHVLKSHKIVVYVEGWQQVFPVSVDKVGIYFREAKPEVIQNESARIVFDISLEPNARKMITVRSALLVFNRTPNTIELQFEVKDNPTFYLVPDATMSVPLSLVRSKMRVRPCEAGVFKCKEPLKWEHVRRPNEASGELLVCSPISVTGQQHSSYTNSLPYYISVSVNRLNFPPDSNFQRLQSFRALPAHRISLLPPVQITNLLPYEIRFGLQNSTSFANVKPGKKHCLQNIDTTKEFTLFFSLDNFPKSNPLTIIPGSARDYTIPLEIFDRKDRPLILQAQITAVSHSHAFSIVISCRYWLINRTGLPLVFKQDSIDHEAAGQFDEHEVARCIVPLLFNFMERDGSLACKVRLGKSLGRSCWTNSFFLHPGTRVRRLRIASNDPRRPDNVYEIGIDVVEGRGRYRGTLMVTFSPRYQIENTSSFKLEVIQKFAAYSDEIMTDNIITVMSNSNVAFQWSRTDQDKLLCVRIASLPNCHWSGGFAIEPNSFHLNVRDESGKSHFIRVEILLEKATFFIVFSDAINLPPPIRIDNFSEVPIEFFQTNITHPWMKTIVRPRSSLPYAWDESTLNPYITVCAPGGCSATYNMNSLRPGDTLTYENFFYIAFKGTFLAVEEDGVNVMPLKANDIKSLQLVLDVPEGSTDVILNIKEPGKRSQLWRIGSDGGRIHHEGSSPPRDPRNTFLRSERNDFVLDISTHCVVPGEVPLMIRKIDNKRSFTQFWKFTSDNRLVCEHPDLCVQPKGGFLGLKAGNQAVLAKMQSVTYVLMENGTPFEQAIEKQKMRKGSGMLAVQVLNDGPTRVLQIVDVRNIPASGLRALDKQLVISNDAKSGFRGWLGFELKLNINASSFGFSLVNKYNEELLYASLGEVIFEYYYKLIEHFFNCSVRYFQVDNQLREAEKPVVLCNTELDANDPMSHFPVLSISVHKLILPQIEIEFFERVQVKIRDITLNVEELLLLKLFQFFSYPEIENDTEVIDDNEEMNVHKAITSALSKSPRLYFTTLEIELNCVKLSVLSTSHLPQELSLIKKKANLRLIRFEDVSIQLLPFQKNYSLETFHFLLNAMFQHYKMQLKSQSAKILGAVDFLGNPIGFVNDVADGLNEFITEGNVHGLISNIAHAFSDSTAKFTSALSDSLGIVAMDARHEEIRKRIKQENNDYLKAGFKGLGVGLLGGLFSIVSQTYSGVSNDGVPGFFSGFGKGVIGTFTKPAVGMLDFATSAASVVRDSSRKTSSTSSQMEKTRLPRQCYGVTWLLLPRFDVEQSVAQQFFFKFITDKEEGEMFISFATVLPNIAVLITSEKVRFISWGEELSEKGKVQVAVSFQNLVRCQTFTEMNVPGSGVFRYYIILSVDSESSISTIGKFDTIIEFKSNRIRVRSATRQTAIEVTEHINCAKTNFDERKFTLLLI